MMQEESAAVAVKCAAGVGCAVSAAFGLTWWAMASALAGAAVSLLLSKQSATGLLKSMATILGLGFIAALMASALPSIPGFKWTAEVPVAVRAGLLGALANLDLLTSARDLLSRLLSAFWPSKQ